MIVVDASILVPALADDGGDGHRCRARLATEELVAPELLDIEVCSVVRRLRQRGLVTAPRASSAIRDLAATPIRRVAHRQLIRRVWNLRDNLSAYDASYVAVAEIFGLLLVTSDAGLARAPGPRCTIELVT